MPLPELPHPIPYESWEDVLQIIIAAFLVHPSIARRLPLLRTIHGMTVKFDKEEEKTPKHLFIRGFVIGALAGIVSPFLFNK